MSTNNYQDTITIGAYDTINFDNMSSVLTGPLHENSVSGTNYGYYTTDGTGYTDQIVNSGHPWVTVGTSAPNSLEVKGDANFEGDIKFKGRSLEELFSKIEDRLAILQPDPAKLEKYEALRKAYEHYKLMEKLVSND
jgi:hypothetical protein